MKTVIILVGGSDLFSGLRGVSAGTRRIAKAVRDHYDEVIIMNYNYFLDGGRSRINHSNIERLLVEDVITLLTPSMKKHLFNDRREC